MVMGNTPIHKPATVRNCIEERDYECVYLPAPRVKREAFDNGDTLTPRIMKSCSEVTLKDCKR